MDTQKSYEYINDFLYFVIRPDKRRGEGVWIYCSGVNVARFSPLTKGRHGIGSNPSVRGLQLVNLSVRDRALSQGATPKRIRGDDCSGIAPTEGTWYTELLSIEKMPESFPGEMIEYGVVNLLKKIFKAGMLESQPPDNLLKPEELQGFLDSLCREYGASKKEA